jgi:hypothetical protein
MPLNCFFYSPFTHFLCFIYKEIYPWVALRWGWGEGVRGDSVYINLSIWIFEKTTFEAFKVDWLARIEFFVNFCIPSCRKNLKFLRLFSLQPHCITSRKRLPIRKLSKRKGRRQKIRLRHSLRGQRLPPPPHRGQGSPPEGEVQFSTFQILRTKVPTFWEVWFCVVTG